MLAKHTIDHQDVIRIIGSSTRSFDDAVRKGIASIKHGHQGTPRDHLDFVTFEVVQLQGTIDSEGKNPQVSLYQAVLDVVGVHHHHGGDNHDHDH